MTILQICQNAADELSLFRPSTVVDALDETARKLNRHLTKTVTSLAKRYDWQILRKQHTFFTNGAETQATAIPSDFLRFVQGSMYNRTQRRPILGPLAPTEWQAYQASTTRPVQPTFYKRGNTVLFLPEPPEGETCAFEYITSYIGVDANEAAISRFSGDNDEPYLNAELITLGIIYRYRQAERLDYAEELRDFELAYADLVKQDGGRRILDMDTKPVDPNYNVNGNLGDYFVTT